MCFGSGGKDADQQAEAAKSKEIDGLIRQDARKKDNEVKLLLLGAGESGKSTVLKQMKLIYASGFSRAEREDCRSIIFSNLNSAFKVILEAMDDMDIQLENPQNQQFAELIHLEHELAVKESFPMQYLRAFDSLWHDAGIKQAIVKGNEYALHDNLT
ncbi:MAG: hypothetical protein M1833_001130 [Piccolia ochrophora]|nr:MAG: hypothetical protein M1833_001130 [Piccolia ochrophora]